MLLGAGMCPVCWRGPVFASSWGTVLVLPAEWPLLGWRCRGLGGGGPPLRGSPGPPLWTVPALLCCGGPRRSLRWLLLGLFLVPGDRNRAGWGVAGTPLKGSSGGAWEVLRVGSTGAAGGLWAVGRSPCWGGCRAWGCCGVALLFPSSTGAPQAQQLVGLPAALLHGDVDETLHKAACVALQGGAYEQGQGLLVEAKEAQAGDDQVQRCGGFPAISPQESSQLLAQPGQQGLQHLWVQAEEGGPDVGVEAAHRSCRHRSCSLWSGGCWATESARGWAARNSLCLLGDERCLCRWWDDELLEAVIGPHRVHDGADSPLAEGALGLVVHPLLDASEAKLVETWHHIAGVVPGVKANGAATVQHRGHALQLRQWAGWSRG